MISSEVHCYNIIHNGSKKVGIKKGKQSVIKKNRLRINKKKQLATEANKIGENEVGVKKVVYTSTDDEALGTSTFIEQMRNDYVYGQVFDSFINEENDSIVTSNDATMDGEEEGVTQNEADNQSVGTDEVVTPTNKPHKKPCQTLSSQER